MIRRTIAALFGVLLVGFAAAQPPVDYVLLCDGEAVGAASLVGGELHVAITAGTTCEGTLSLEGSDLAVIFDVDADGGITVTIDETSAMAKERPPQAVAGMVRARENRAAAFQNRTRGEENAATHRPAKDEPSDEDVVENLPETPELTVPLGRPDASTGGAGRRP